MSVDSGAIRDRLLAEIRRRRPEFEAAGNQAEELRTLPAETVATLRDLGIMWLKTPAELGGTPLDPLDFCDVLEELAYCDSATAWTAMVGNGGSGTAGGWLPDAGARRVFGSAFASGQPMPLVVGTPGPRGTGRAVDGGYVVSGRWGFASGAAQADWLLGGFQVGESGRLMVAVVPRSQAEVIDNWHVAGLKGSGSFDFRLSEVFVPVEMTFERAASACRGGALFHAEAHVFLSNELPPLAVGIARRALDDMTVLASRTSRLPGGPALAERAVFHAVLGRAQARISAARLVHRDAVSAAYRAARLVTGDLEGVHVGIAATSVYAVETCCDVIADLFRYGGGRVLSLSQPVQRYLRDCLATRQHIGLSEENYERAGRHLLASAAATRRQHPR